MAVMRGQAVVVVLALAQLLYLCLNLNAPLSVYDEGIPLYGAFGILHGQIPYRDFYTTGYAPGQAYTLAALFAVFGSNLWVERLYDIALRLALGGGAFLVAGRLAPRPVALLTWCLITVATLPTDFYFGYVTFPAVLMTLLAIWFFQRYVAGQQPRQLFACGVCVGGVAWFRHDFGGYTGLVLGGALLVFLMGQARGAGGPWRSQLLASARRSAVFAAGVGAVVLPVAGYLLWNVPPGDLWSDLFVGPLLIFPRARALPYPALIPHLAQPADWLNWLLFYFPLLVSIGGLVAFLWARRAAPATPAALWQATEQRAGLVLLLVLADVFWLQAVSRNDEVHRLPSHLLTLVALTALLALQCRSRRQRPLILGASIVLGPLLLYYLILLPTTQVKRAGLWPPLVCPAGAARAGCVVLDPNQAQAVAYVQAHTRADERIFVGLSRHDLTYSNDASFYFLADRLAAGKYDALVPGVTTTAPVQQGMVADLLRYKVRYVVLWDAPDHAEPNASSVSSGVTILDDFIHQEYHPVAQFGAYTILTTR